MDTTDKLSETYYNVISKRICENLKMIPIEVEKVNKINLRDFQDDFQHLNILEPIMKMTNNHVNYSIEDIPSPMDIDDFLINIDNISKKFIKPTLNVGLPTQDQQQQNYHSPPTGSSSTTTTTTTTTTTVNRERLGSTNSVRSVSSVNSNHQDKNEHYYNNVDYEIKSNLSDELINQFNQCKIHLKEKKRLNTIDLLESDIDKLQMFLEKFEHIIKMKEQQQQQQQEPQHDQYKPIHNIMELQELLKSFTQVIDDFIFLKENENIYKTETLPLLKDPLAECLNELLNKKY